MGSPPTVTGVMGPDDARAAARARLVAAGLGHHADALIARGLPSIRLRSQPAAEPRTPRYRLPAPVDGLPGPAVAIASSGYHYLALLANGSVAAWGENAAGQLGDGTRANRRAPVVVDGVAGATAIAAGGETSLALLEDGSVVGWGSNRYGELGGGVGPDRLRPGPVPGLERDVVALAGGPPTRVVTRDGKAWALGLGAGDEGGIAGILAAPVLVAIPAPGLRLGGWGNRIAVLADGTVARWPGYTMGSVAPPRLPGLDGIVAVAGGAALTEGGSVVTWNTETPAVLPGLDHVVALTAGPYCTFALKQDGTVWAWGSGSGGQLGDGADHHHDVPVPVPGVGEDVVAIASQLALKSDGSVWAWGGVAPADDEGADTWLPIGASKLGGRPDAPKGFAWPAYDGRPLSFVAQVNLPDVSPLDEDRLLPPTGLLSFFYDELPNPPGSIVWSVRVWDSDAALVRAALPHELGDGWRHVAVPLVPEAEFSLFPFAPESFTLDEIEAYLYEALPQHEKLHRMLGHPDLIQNTPEPGVDALLLQVDLYDEAAFPGSAGRLYFLISDDDLRQRRFDQVWCDYECD